MAIAIRARSEELTRRQLLVRSASTLARRLARTALAETPDLSQHGRPLSPPPIACGIQSGDVCSDSAVVWARADRPARMRVECSSVESFAKTIIRSSSGRCIAGPRLHRKTAARGTAARSGYFLPQSAVRNRESSLRAGSRARRRSGISAPRRSNKARSRRIRFHSSGPAIPLARAGASIPTRGGMRTYRTACSKNRPGFLHIHSGDHIYADCPGAVGVGNCANGETWPEHRHGRKIRGRAQLSRAQFRARQL